MGHQQDSASPQTYVFFRSDDVISQRKDLRLEFPLFEDDTLRSRPLKMDSTIYFTSTLRGGHHTLDLALIMNPTRSTASRLNKDRTTVARVVHALMRASIKIASECRESYVKLLHFSIHLQNRGSTLMIEGVNDAIQRLQFKDYLTIPSTIYARLPPHNIKTTASGFPAPEGPYFNENDIKGMSLKPQCIVIDGYPKYPTSEDFQFSEDEEMDPRSGTPERQEAETMV